MLSSFYTLFRQNTGQLGRGALAAFVVNVLALVVSYGQQVILTRTLSLQSFGSYSYVMAWIGVMVLLGSGGITSVFLRFISQYDARGEFGLLHALVRWGAVRVLGISLILSVVLVFTTEYLGEAISPELSHTFLFGAAFIPTWGMLLLRQSLFRGLKRVFAARIPDVIVRPLLLGLGVLLLWEMNQSLVTAPQAMLIHLLAALGALVIGWGIFRIGRAPQNLDVGDDQRREWQHCATPLLWIGLFTALSTEIDKIILGFFQPISEVGLYSAAARLSLFVAFAPDAILTVAVPLLSEFVATREKVELQRLASKVTFLVSVSSVTLTLFLIAFGSPILTFFGESYAEAYSVLVILALGQCVSSSLLVGGFLLVVSGKHEALIRGLLITLIVGGALTVLASMFGSLREVAIVTALSLVARNIIYVRAARDLLGVTVTPGFPSKEHSKGS